MKNYGPKGKCTNHINNHHIGNKLECINENGTWTKLNNSKKY